MQNFVELLKDHSLLMASAKALVEITFSHEPQPAAAFNALRRLCSRLDVHLRAEDEFLKFDDDFGHREFAALAAEHGQRFETLVVDWQLYLKAWPQEMMGSDWQAFGEATLAIIGALAEQIEAENQALYPAALKYGLIRLLPEGGRDAINAA